ncbi:MAG: F0F1 ATP synthase subunit B [Anaerolineae bacterium]
MERLGFNPAIFIAYLVNFAILAFFLQRYAFKPVLNMLDQRRQRIAEGLGAAEKAQQEAAAQRAEFEKELAKARQQAADQASKIAQETEKMREQILADARKEAEEIVARAREQVEVERQQVQADMQRQVVNLTIDLTRKVVGQSLDEGAQRQMINQFLAEMGESS